MAAKYSCQILAGLLVAHGVKRVVLSPGSRNAPIILAIDECSEYLQITSVIDERTAAFIALGMAHTSGEPVALVCTSGTAMLNYAPAVAEAYYRHIPLIVITADRPMQWIDQDDSQTIRQPGALDNFVKFSCNLPDFSDPSGEMAWYARRSINEAISESTAQPHGPVHINMQLSEPLTADFPAIEVPEKVEVEYGQRELSRTKIKSLANEASALKVMIVAGFMPPDSVMQKAISRLAELPNVVVLTEAMANIKSEQTFPNIDRILKLAAPIPELKPDLIISVGGALVSRHLKAYLRSCQGLKHWSVGYGRRSADVFMHLSARYVVDPSRFLLSLADCMCHLPIESDYSRLWHSLDARDKALHEEILHRAPWSSLKGFDIIWPLIPEGTNLELSNGTCVRYAQLFCGSNPGIHRVSCNRGTSGIDGSTSTALGASLAYKRGMTLLITGDMSFAYDIGALSVKAPSRLKIIVINNRGGGIFRFIKSTRNLPVREEYFCADPGIDILAISAAQGFASFRATNEQELRGLLPDFFACPQKAILEIVVDAESDAQAITDYFNIIDI